ncbi:putative zinc ion binding protein [Hibiscus syriacus]|uniref:RBR-type E3 ubiquitin transferase n=1 Tax=Hibiscus syriacus TaxID=106335 RepID=A0A6A3D7S6_HIBSY|nr:putative zinc ion binding protein [Hibiscus syriacus]
MVIFQGPNLKLKFTSLHFSFTQKSRKFGCKLGKFLNGVIREVHDAKDPHIDDESEEIFFTPRESLDRLGYEIGDGNCYDCGICGEMKLVDDSFDVRGCSHFYCVDCTVKFIESKLDDNVSSIKCPEPDCEGVLDPEFSARSFPGICLTDGGTPFVNLPSLAPRNSIVAWHSGLSCAKFRELEPLGPDALFADLAKRKSWKRCPHCKNYVEKSSGCNYMKCKCGKAFCYDCGATSTSSITHICYNSEKTSVDGDLSRTQSQIEVHISSYFVTQKSRKIGCKLGKFLNGVIREVHDAKDPLIDDENEEIFFTPRESLDSLGYEIGDGSGYGCGICGEMKPVDDSFDVRGCSHFYCVDCTVKFIESKLDYNVSSIKCPESDCEGVLDPEFCREILPWDLFNRWGNALCESAFFGSEKFYCPFRDCSALLINDGKRVIKKYRCPFCKRAVQGSLALWSELHQVSETRIPWPGCSVR